MPTDSSQYHAKGPVLLTLHVKRSTFSLPTTSMCICNLLKYAFLPISAACAMVEEGKKERSPLMSGYHFYPRPAEVSHGHPFLVFNCQEELHLPLTVFAKEAHMRLAPSSVKKYLMGILSWFSWLDTDPWQTKANHQWTDPPEVIRPVLREYDFVKPKNRLIPKKILVAKCKLPLFLIKYGES